MQHPLFNFEALCTSIKEHHGETEQDLLFSMEKPELEDCVTDT